MRIRLREEWAVREQKFVLPFRGTRYVVVHWTAVPNAADQAVRGTPELLRGMEAWHMDAKSGFAIFYNFVVDQDGVVWEGRGWDGHGGAQGVYESDKQDVSISAILGPGETPSAAMLSALNEFHLLAKQRGWTDGLKGHKDFKIKACPGPDLYEWLQNPTEDENMRIGDSGKDVGKLQEFINRWIYAYDVALDPIAEDEEFGPITETMVTAFQLWADLGSDGVVDPITISSLITVVKVAEAG